MILVLDREISQGQKDQIQSILSDDGCITREITDAGRNLIGIIGKGEKTAQDYKQLEGVKDVLVISTSHKLVSRDFKSEDTKVKIGNVVVGGDRIVVVAGPCAVESHDQAMTRP